MKRPIHYKSYAIVAGLIAGVSLVILVVLTFHRLADQDAANSLSEREPTQSRPLVPSKSDLSSANREGVSEAQLVSVVESAREFWQVPGCSIAVLKDDRIVLLKGFGAKRLGGQPVDSNTLFPIASATKSFNAAMIAQLVDRGTLRWDDLVTQHINVHFHDPALNNRITLRDLLCHRAGLSSSNQMWYRANATRAQIVARMESIRSEHPRGSEFQYSNIGILLAGETAAKVGEQTWPELVRTNLLEPLGMTSTLSDVIDPSRHGNFAAGHHLTIDGHNQLEETPFVSVTNCAPATSMWSTASDLAIWLRFQLNRGAVASGQLISREAMAEMHAPQIEVALDNRFWKMFPDKQSMNAALGWFTVDYRDHKVILHPGNINGVRTLIAFIPDAALGIAVLANREGSGLPIALMYEIVDLYDGHGEVDAATRLNSLMEQQRVIESDHEYVRLVDRATTNLLAGQIEDSIALLDRAIKLDANSVAAYVNRGLATIRLRRFDEANNDLMKAVSINPYCGDAWDAMGWILLQRGQYDKAIEAYTKAVVSDRWSAKFVNDRANAKLTSRDYQGAINDASTAITTDERWANAYAIRGIAHYYSNDFEKAKSDLDTAVGLNPKLLNKRVAFVLRQLKGKLVHKE